MKANSNEKYFDYEKYILYLSITIACKCLVALTLRNGFVSLTNLIYESVDVRYDDAEVVTGRVCGIEAFTVDHSCNSRLEHGFSRLVCLNVQFA